VVDGGRSCCPGSSPADQVAWRQLGYQHVVCPRTVYTDLNGFICKIKKKPSHQGSQGEKFIAQHEEPPIR
jgi:hypothetical protein